VDGEGPLGFEEGRPIRLRLVHDPATGWAILALLGLLAEGNDRVGIHVPGKFVVH
jgi:hypothetical protein